MVASKVVDKDDMEMEYYALVDRIDVLGNTVEHQNRVIQSQQDAVASIKETIYTQAEELKTQRKNIAGLHDTTRKLQYEVKKLVRRAKALESRINGYGSIIGAANDAHHATFDKPSLEIYGKSMEVEEIVSDVKSDPEAYGNVLGLRFDLQIIKQVCSRSNIIERVAYT